MQPQKKVKRSLWEHIILGVVLSTLYTTAQLVSVHPKTAPLRAKLEVFSAPVIESLNPALSAVQEAAIPVMAQLKPHYDLAMAHTVELQKQVNESVGPHITQFADATDQALTVAKAELGKAKVLANAKVAEFKQSEAGKKAVAAMTGASAQAVVFAGHAASHTKVLADKALADGKQYSLQAYDWISNTLVPEMYKQTSVAMDKMGVLSREALSAAGKTASLALAHADTLLDASPIDIKGLYKAACGALKSRIDGSALQGMVNEATGMEVSLCTLSWGVGVLAALPCLTFVFALPSTTGVFSRERPVARFLLATRASLSAVVAFGCALAFYADVRSTVITDEDSELTINLAPVECLAFEGLAAGVLVLHVLYLAIDRAMWMSNVYVVVVSTASLAQLHFLLTSSPIASDGQVDTALTHFLLMLSTSTIAKTCCFQISADGKPPAAAGTKKKPAGGKSKSKNQGRQ